MRFLLALSIFLAIAWSGYWFVGSTAAERGLGLWFDDRRQDGWLADVSSIETRGFPYRFDTTLSDVNLADPRSGIAWVAPFFQILSLTYKPNHIIAIFPQSHRFSSPEQTIDFGATDMRASVVFEPNTLLAIDRTSFVAQDLSAQSTKGWSWDADRFQFATRQTPNLDLAHDISLVVADAEPGGFWKAIVSDAGLPDKIANMEVDATIEFDAPWDRRALDHARPQPMVLDIRSIRAEWGELFFQAKGRLDIDDRGQPVGDLALQIQNWKDVLAIIEASGALPADVVPTVEGGLSLLAGLSGNPNHIDATLTYRAGAVYVGPVAIGQAPYIWIR